MRMGSAQAIAFEGKVKSREARINDFLAQNPVSKDLLDRLNVSEERFKGDVQSMSARIVATGHGENPVAMVLKYICDKVGLGNERWAFWEQTRSLWDYTYMQSLMDVYNASNGHPPE